MQVGISQNIVFGDLNAILNISKSRVWSFEFKSPNARFGDIQNCIQISEHEIWRYSDLHSNIRTRDLEIFRLAFKSLHMRFDAHGDFAKHPVAFC